MVNVNVSGRRSDFKLESQSGDSGLKCSEGRGVPPLNAAFSSLFPQTKERNKLEALKKKLEQEEERMKKMEEEKKKKQEDLRRSAAPEEEESRRLFLFLAFSSTCFVLFWTARPVAGRGRRG